MPRRYHSPISSSAPPRAPPLRNRACVARSGLRARGEAIVMREVRVALALVVVVGCGRFDFDAVPGNSSDDAPAVDAIATDSYSAAVLADHPSGYWRLDDGVGTIAHDEVGTHDGTYVGACELGVAGALSSRSIGGAAPDGSTCNVEIGDAFAFAGRAVVHDRSVGRAEHRRWRSAADREPAARTARRRASATNSRSSTRRCGSSNSKARPTSTTSRPTRRPSARSRTSRSPSPGTSRRCT